MRNWVKKRSEETGSSRQVKKLDYYTESTMSCAPRSIIDLEMRVIKRQEETQRLTELEDQT